MSTIMTKNIPPLTERPIIPVMVDTPRAFRLVLDNATRGQKIIYYEGDLMFDRDPVSPLDLESKSMLNRLASAVYDASRLGKVCLFKKRLGPFKFQYYALVRR